MSMSGTEAALGLFTIFNGVRVFAYVPQMIKIWKDEHGAASISYATWLMFALSHATTVVYSLIVVGDVTLAGIFGVNTAFCTAIILLTIRQRRRFRRSQDLSSQRRSRTSGNLPAMPDDAADLPGALRTVPDCGQRPLGVSS